MAVTSIAYTWYSAENVPNLLAFYRDRLGLRVDRAHPSEQDAQMVEFDLGNDHWFTLMPVAFSDQPAGTSHGVVFEVDDIDAALAAIRGHAKRVDESATDYPGCRTASFEDPEGNKVGLHQMKSG